MSAQLQVQLELGFVPRGHQVIGAPDYVRRRCDFHDSHRAQLCPGDAACKVSRTNRLGMKWHESVGNQRLPITKGIDTLHLIHQRQTFPRFPSRISG